MIKTVGAVLIGCSAVHTGFTLSVQMRKRLAAVSAFRDSVIRIQQRTACYRTPLPVLLRELGVEAQGAVGAFYTMAAERLDKNRTRTAEAVLLRCLKDAQMLGLPRDGVQCAAKLFRCLGRLDGERQAEALHRLVEELDELEAILREELRGRSRCWCAVGICGGLAVTILLI